LVEAYTFLKGDADIMQIYMQRYEDALGKLKVLGEVKGDADMMQIYMQRYEDALGKLKVLGEGYNRTDSYRSG
jgi:hypothetical protein